MSKMLTHSRIRLSPCDCPRSLPRRQERGGHALGSWEADERLAGVGRGGAHMYHQAITGSKGLKMYHVAFFTSSGRRDGDGMSSSLNLFHERSQERLVPAAISGCPQTLGAEAYPRPHSLLFTPEETRGRRLELPRDAFLD